MKSNLIKIDPTYTFYSMMDGDEPKVCKTFKEAFTHMFNWVNEQLKGGGLSYQVLETAIWIETPGGSPIFFYDARDLACEQGILVDGKLA